MDWASLVSGFMAFFIDNESFFYLFPESFQVLGPFMNCGY